MRGYQGIQAVERVKVGVRWGRRCGTEMSEEVSDSQECLRRAVSLFSQMCSSCHHRSTLRVDLNSCLVLS